MKKLTKVLVACMLFAVMAVSMTGCGVDMSKVKGDWVVSSINGQSPADFAAASGVAEVYCMKTYNITDDKVTCKAVGADGAVATVTGDVVKKADGIESNIGGVTFGFLLNESDNTLSYSVTDGTNTVKYVLSKGTYDFESNLAALNGGSTDQSQGGEEGGEENVEE